MHESCQSRGAAVADDVDVFCIGDGHGGGFKAFPGGFLQGVLDLIHVEAQDFVQNVVAADPVLGYLDALDGGELGADDLLKRPGKLRVALKAQFVGEAHHGGFADANGGAQFGGSHEGGFIRMDKNVIGNAPLALGKFTVALMNLCDNVHKIRSDPAKLRAVSPFFLLFAAFPAEKAGYFLALYYYKR